MKKIYIVEDDDGIRDVLQVFLQLEEFQVKSFATISEFKRRDLSAHPDLYLFDVQLPDGLGTDLCQHVKSLPEGKNIPVIMMSAHASTQNIASVCPADEIMVKPFDIGVLLKKIKTLLSD